MCSTTGTGMAKKRALSGVIPAPAVSSVTRTAPASTGTKLRTIRPAGTSQPALGAGAAVVVVLWRVMPRWWRPEWRRLIGTTARVRSA